MSSFNLLRYGNTILKLSSSCLFKQSFHIRKKLCVTQHNPTYFSRHFATGHQNAQVIDDHNQSTTTEAQRKMSSAKSSTLNSAGKETVISVTWSDGSVSKFASLHLRDSCRCDECFGKTALHRKLNLYHEIPFDVEPNNVWVDGDKLHVEWQDGHRSSYDQERLARLHSCAGDFNFYHDRKDTKYWESGYEISKYQYDSVMGNDSTLIDFALTLKTHGIALVKNVPCKEGQIRIFGGRFGKLRHTLYMDVFTVKSKASPSNLAYTSGELKLHIDLVCCANMPHVQMLHCLCPSESGGENIFVDGLNCADHLRESDPESFELLCQYKWPFYDIAFEQGRMHYVETRHPVIQLNQYNKIDKIAYSNFSRDDIAETNVEIVYKLYKAWYAFSEILNDRKFTVEHLLEDGDMAVLDNGRVLHGRKSFSMQSNSKTRHYEGGYLEWDDIMSTLRVAQKRHTKF